MKKKAFLLFLPILAACSPTVVTRGNLIGDNVFAEIKPQVSKRADVSAAWGPPTTASSFDQNTWYYIGETTAQRGIFAPEVEKRRLVRVRFSPDDSDTVTAVDDLDPKLAKDIDLVSRKTPTAGREFTAVQQIIGNIGKYNTKQQEKAGP